MVRQQIYCHHPCLTGLGTVVSHLARWRHHIFVYISNSHLISISVAGQLHSIWVTGQGCVNLQTKDKVLLATYIYSTCLDTVVMALSGWKLVVYSRVIPNSRFINILFRDGLVYYAFVWVFRMIFLSTNHIIMSTLEVYSEISSLWCSRS